MELNPATDPAVRRKGHAIIPTIALASIALTGAACGASKKQPTTFVEGCSPYTVFAQNRWAPLGAALRQAPGLDAAQISGYKGNTSIIVDGWGHYGPAVYPHNTPPWNSNIWFHVAGDKGWVSFPGVRGGETTPDPTGFQNGGPVPLTPANCEAAGDDS